MKLRGGCRCRLDRVVSTWRNVQAYCDANHSLGASDKSNVLSAFREQCDGYLVKPLEKSKLLDYLREFELIDQADGE